MLINFEYETREKIKYTDSHHYTVGEKSQTTLEVIYLTLKQKKFKKHLQANLTSFFVVFPDSSKGICIFFIINLSRLSDA